MPLIKKFSTLNINQAFRVTEREREREMPLIFFNMYDSVSLINELQSYLFNDLSV